MQATRSGSAVALAGAGRSQELTSNWLRKLSATSNDSASREAQSQLQGILDYYNIAKDQKALEAIDWDGFRERIHTSGVVDKIQSKYDKFMESEYSVESAVSRCGNTTEQIRALDTAMQYNFMLYFVHYMTHLEQLETMHNIGDVTKMSMFEFSNYHDEIIMQQDMDREIGQMAPSSWVEDGVHTR